MIKRKHPISQLELLRMKHRALRMKKYRPIQQMSPRISSNIWQSPVMHSFSRPLSPINKEYVEPEERKDKKEMNWFQAKKAFPKLPLFGDADKDGIYNMFDCRPFNKKKQGPEHEDQLGWDGGEGERQASRNISRIARDLKYENTREQMRMDVMEKTRPAHMDKTLKAYNEASDARYNADTDNDQIGFDDETASKNITDITKRYKNRPF